MNIFTPLTPEEKAEMRLVMLAAVVILLASYIIAGAFGYSHGLY
jgi:hypothetical protein